MLNKLGPDVGGAGAGVHLKTGASHLYRPHVRVESGSAPEPVT